MDSIYLYTRFEYHLMSRIDRARELDPDFAIFTALTPFQGTEIYEAAKKNGWIEDFNL